MAGTRNPRGSGRHALLTSRALRARDTPCGVRLACDHVRLSAKINTLTAARQQTSSVPRVSVVIPTFERCDVITRAVQSVLRQELNGLEVIVVDDGSTDGSESAVGAIEDGRVRYVPSVHRGAAAARNIGALQARARWLTFLDSDDTVTPDWLSSMLAETASPDIALVSCGYTERAEDSSVVRRQRLPRLASPAIGPITELIATGGTYLVLRELFLDIGGFDPDQPAAQHRELALRLGPALVRRGLRAGAVMRPLVERWVGRRDQVRADDAAVLAGGSRLLDRHRERLVLDPPLLADTAASAAYRAVRIGDFGEARRLMLLAVRTQPRRLRHWARLCALMAPRAARGHALRRRPGDVYR
jgi:Glycosyl transferase family 2